MLRRIDTGQLTPHNFLNAEHALEWLKKDTTNEERFTVCLGTIENIATGVCLGHFKETRHEIEAEMTVSQFISEALTAKDKKHDKKNA